MALGVHSEVGKLRRVLIHRPGLEHTRLTPSNAEELVFDDVLWVKKAKEEHDAFAEVMRERGVEVYHAEQLLAEAIVKPEVKDWACDHILNEREVGIAAAFRAREWVQTADRTLVAEFLIGGITRADVQPNVELEWESADPTSMLLSPLPTTEARRCSVVAIADPHQHRPSPPGQGPRPAAAGRGGGDTARPPT
jgi:arginine deiminase